MTVEVRLIGHLGNNLFQYALGRIISEHLEQELIVRPAKDIRGWNEVERMSGIIDRLQYQFDHFADVPLGIAGKQVSQPQMIYIEGGFRRWNGHTLNLPYVLEQGKGHRIVLRGYFQRTEYYQPYKSRIKEWFQMGKVVLPVEPGPGDIVVHIRRSPDMFVLDRALDLSYYSELLAGLSFDRVLVCGLGIDARTKQVLAPFNPVYLNMDASTTLYLLTRSNRIVLANSTFSWWGAYLSEAEEIYFPRPVRSVWSPETPEIALEVEESRYRYVDQVPVENWRPFRIRDNTQFVWNSESQNVRMVEIIGPMMNKTKLELPVTLGPALNRIVSMQRSFGLPDFDDLEMKSQVRVGLLRLLQQLEKKGALEVEPGTFKVLQSTARGLRGFLG